MYAKYDSLSDVARSTFESMGRLTTDYLAGAIMKQIAPSLSTASGASAARSSASPAPPQPVDININIDPAAFSSPPDPNYIASVVHDNLRRRGKVRIATRRYI